MERMSYVGDLPFHLRSICHRSPGGTIPAGTYRLLVFVGFRLPVISRQVSFRAGFSFFAWAERSYTGHAYSAAE